MMAIGLQGKCDQSLNRDWLAVAKGPFLLSPNLLTAESLLLQGVRIQRQFCSDLEADEQGNQIPTVSDLI